MSFQQFGPMGGMPAQPMVSFGDIHVTQAEVITPRGSIPLSQAQFTFTDSSTTQRVIPTWAIVLAVLLALFFFLGLLFLLVKEDRTTGSVSVAVIGPRFMHQVTLPAMSRQQVQDLAARVQYANNLAASSR